MAQVVALSSKLRSHTYTLTFNLDSKTTSLYAQAIVTRQRQSQTKLQNFLVVHILQSVSSCLRLLSVADRRLITTMEGPTHFFPYQPPFHTISQPCSMGLDAPSGELFQRFYNCPTSRKLKTP